MTGSDPGTSGHHSPITCSETRGSLVKLVDLALDVAYSRSASLVCRCTERSLTPREAELLVSSRVGVRKEEELRRRSELFMLQLACDLGMHAQKSVLTDWSESSDNSSLQVAITRQRRFRRTSAIATPPCRTQRARGLAACLCTAKTCASRKPPSTSRCHIAPSRSVVRSRPWNSYTGPSVTLQLASFLSSAAVKSALPLMYNS